MTIAKKTTTKRKTGPKRDWGETLNKVTVTLGKYHVYEILAFILPFLFLGFGFYKKTIHPFGEQQFLVTDLWHQYYPFFQILQDKLTHGGSLLYTWISGLGTNFLALMSYYAASPLNLLSVFMPKDFLRDGLLFILMLKFSFAGLFFARMLRYVFDRNDLSLTMFGLMYALCSYMMGYYWNIIWIDTVALLPLVIKGLVALVREGKYRTYVISLAISLIASYYIGYMVCLFVVIAFFLICLFESIPFKTFLKRFGMVAGTSVLGAGISAWILFPAFHALQLTHSANNSFPKSVTWYEAWEDVLGNMLAFTDPTSKEGLPNLYCGLLPVLLLGVFLVSARIRIREKISGLLLMTFLIISCNMNVLNYIWHAFHFPNMLPYRFSFLFSFVLLVAGYRAYTTLLEKKLSILEWAAMLPVGFIFCYLGFNSTKIGDDDDHKFVTSCIILGTAYLIILFMRLFAPRQVVQFLLAGAMVYEMGCAAVNGVDTVGSSGYNSYPSNNEEIQELMHQAEKLDNEPFYRTELTGWYTLNDPSLYLYNGVSQFSSMANEHVTTYLRKIGLPASEAGNRYFYANTSPLTNMLLDVQYIMAKDGYNADSLTMHQICSSGTCTIYKVDYSLGLGFVADPSISYLTLEDDLNAFDQQNKIFRQMTGLSKDLFVATDITHVGHTGYDVTRREYGKYNYTRQDEAGADSFLKYNYTYTKDGMGYALMNVTNGENMEVLFENSSQHRYNIGRQPYITPVGYHKADEMISLRCNLKEENKTGTIEVFFYQLDEDVLNEGYERLKMQSLQLKDFSDTGFTGEITARRDGCMYLSIPYEAGWTLYVDGKKTELYPVFDAMCAADVTAGTHEIRMKYVPKGFVPGVCITVLSLGVLIALYVIERKKRSTEQPDETAKEEPAEVTAEAETAPAEETPTEEAPAEEETPAEAEPAEEAPAEPEDAE